MWTRRANPQHWLQRAHHSDIYVFELTLSISRRLLGRCCCNTYIDLIMFFVNFCERFRIALLMKMYCFVLIKSSIKLHNISHSKYWFACLSARLGALRLGEQDMKRTPWWRPTCAHSMRPHCGWSYEFLNACSLNDRPVYVVILLHLCDDVRLPH